MIGRRFVKRRVRLAWLSFICLISLNKKSVEHRGAWRHILVSQKIDRSVDL